jgi:hypothetical protein
MNEIDETEEEIKTSGKIEWSCFGIDSIKFN